MFAPARSTLAAHDPRFQVPSDVQPDAKIEKLYQRIQNQDDERTSGAQYEYKSFDDFVTTFNTEANDPHVIGAADILDIINPLQHLPLVSTLYRDLTDDHIKPGARIMGGAMFGGGVGLASSSVNVAVENKTGHDVTENMALAFSGEKAFANQPTPSRPEDQLPQMAMGLTTPPPIITNKQTIMTPDENQSGEISTPQSEESANFSSTPADLHQPNRPITPAEIVMTWNDFNPETQKSPQHIAATYSRAQKTSSQTVNPMTKNTTTPSKTTASSDLNDDWLATPHDRHPHQTKTYEIVRMTDPERMAGSFARYI